MLEVFATYSFFYLSKGFPRTSGWQILQQIFYLAFFFISKRVCGIPQYRLVLSLLKSSYRYWLLHSPDHSQECCLVYLTFWLSAANTAPLLAVFFYDRLSSLDHFEGCYSLSQSIFFNLFTVFMQVTICNYISRIFLTKSHFSYEFSPNSDRFRVFVLLSPILINLLMCPGREIKTLNFSR